jgi:hypothetical protein
LDNPIPPAPPGWNKTIEDLLAEVRRGERKSVGSPELDWARQYMRSMIPEGTRYPRKGDVYEATADVEVRYITHWAAPFTGGGTGTLKAGERVRVIQDMWDPKPVGFYAQPINLADVEQRLVPLQQRADPKYSGFSLSLRTIELKDKFRLLNEDP